MLSSDLIRRISLVAALALFPLLAWGAPSPAPTREVEVHLEGQVKIAGEQVVLGDVATIYARNLQSFKALSALVLSRIPDDQQEVRLPASYLEARVRAALPPGTDFALHAPHDIVFKLERLGVSAQDFSREVERMARAGGKAPSNTNLEIIPISGLEQLKAASLAKVRVEPQSEMDRWRGDLSFKVTRTDVQAPPVWVRARVRWFSKVWVAARPIAYSETPGAAHFVEGRIETTNLREEPLSGSPEELAQALKGTKLRRAIAANAALLPSMLERKPDASPGSSLRVEFVSESGIRVGADGLLVGPGSIGGDVKARLKSSKKIVTGKLVSQGLMEVSL